MGSEGLLICGDFEVFICFLLSFLRLIYGFKKFCLANLSVRKRVLKRVNKTKHNFFKGSINLRGQKRIEAKTLFFKGSRSIERQGGKGKRNTDPPREIPMMNRGLPFRVAFR